MNYTCACDCTAFQITCNLEEFSPNAVTCCIIHETDVIIREIFYVFLHIFLNIFNIKITLKRYSLLQGIDCNLIADTVIVSVIVQ